MSGGEVSKLNEGGRLLGFSVSVLNNNTQGRQFFVPRDLEETIVWLTNLIRLLPPLTSPDSVGQNIVSPGCLYLECSH